MTQCVRTVMLAALCALLVSGIGAQETPQQLIDDIERDHHAVLTTCRTTALAGIAARLPDQAWADTYKIALCLIYNYHFEEAIALLEQEIQSQQAATGSVEPLLAVRLTQALLFQARRDVRNAGAREGEDIIALQREMRRVEHFFDVTRQLENGILHQAGLPRPTVDQEATYEGRDRALRVIAEDHADDATIPGKYRFALGAVAAMRATYVAQILNDPGHAGLQTRQMVAWISIMDAHEAYQHDPFRGGALTYLGAAHAISYLNAGFIGRGILRWKGYPVDLATGLRLLNIAEATERFGHDGAFSYLLVLVESQRAESRALTLARKLRRFYPSNPIVRDRLLAALINYGRMHGISGEERKRIAVEAERELNNALRQFTGDPLLAGAVRSLRLQRRAINRHLH